jgi:tetratricopeptide (TPR) repeat protein
VGRLRERERELAAVEVLLERCCGVLVVEGRAGIGKTSLVEMACSRAEERGCEVVRARGSELETGFAFGVVRPLFERRIATAEAGEREALLAGSATAVRLLLSGERAAEPSADSSYAVLHGLYWLVANLAASRPLLIAVDDAHWADEPSLRWLAYLAARLEGLAAGMLMACVHLEEALQLVTGQRERAEIALEVAETYAALFRWVDAVDVLERALAGLGETDHGLAARLEGEPVVCGLHDARRAGRVAPALARLRARRLEAGNEPLAVAEAMTMLLAGRPADQIAGVLEEALARAGPEVENWDTRAALLWVLVVAERFAAADRALGPMLAQIHRCGSARGFVAAYSTLGLLKLRLGALPEADAAARVALSVLLEGDFAPGIAFAATVLADVAVEAGEPGEAQALLDLLPQEGWPAGVGTVLIPAARGRLRLAQGRAADALADFQTCSALLGTDVWGMQIHETGYVHARSGAALALLRLGQRQRACQLADAELADVRVFGAPRALGIALRAAGLVRGPDQGLPLLQESVAVLESSPALLERAHSLAEFGAALRRSGERAAARDPLARALDLAARCGARPLAGRVRDELKAAGARPRRPWRTGVEALTPSELRVARLAAEGRSNRRSPANSM